MSSSVPNVYMAKHHLAFASRDASEPTKSITIMVTPTVIQRQSGDATQEGLKKFYRDNAISRLEVVKRTHPKYIFSPKNRVHEVTVIMDIMQCATKNI